SRHQLAIDEPPLLIAYLREEPDDVDRHQREQLKRGARLMDNGKPEPIAVVAQLVSAGHSEPTRIGQMGHLVRANTGNSNNKALLIAGHLPSRAQGAVLVAADFDNFPPGPLRYSRKRTPGSAQLFLFTRKRHIPAPRQHC